MRTQYVEWSKTLMKPQRQEAFPIVSFLWIKLSRKTSLLVTFKTLGLFVNTLTADDKYSSYEKLKFPQAIQMHLSKKPKINYQLFIAFLQSTSTFQHFEKEDERHTSTLSDVIDSKRFFLLKCLKGYVLGHPWKLNVLTGPKH